MVEYLLEEPSKVYYMHICIQQIFTEHWVLHKKYAPNVFPAPDLALSSGSTVENEIDTVLASMNPQTSERDIKQVHPQIIIKFQIVLSAFNKRSKTEHNTLIELKGIWGSGAEDVNGG